MPFFSIILPTNKSQAAIENSVLSCLSTSFSDYELNIGVQDWSAWFNKPANDEKLFDHPRVKLIDSSSCKNLPSNLNNLINTSSHSAFLVRHDDDDFMHPSRMERLFKYKIIIENAFIVGQSYKYIDGTTHKILAEMHPARSSNANKKSLLLGPCFAHPAITINVSKLRYFYDEDYSYAQDYKLYVDNFSSGDFVGLPGMATYYSAPNQSASSYSQKRIKQLIFHDQCMFKLWNFILGANSVSMERITNFRRKFVSSDDVKFANKANLACNDDDLSLIGLYDQAINILSQCSDDEMQPNL